MQKNMCGNSGTIETYFLSPNCCQTQITKNIKTSKYFFYRSVTSPFAAKLFLLPFSSHCSTKNIGFNDSEYVIKPPQPSSAIYGAPTFTGSLKFQLHHWLHKCAINYIQFTHKKTVVSYEKPLDHYVKRKNTKSRGKTLGVAPLVKNSNQRDRNPLQIAVTSSQRNRRSGKMLMSVSIAGTR